MAKLVRRGLKVGSVSSGVALVCQEVSDEALRQTVEPPPRATIVQGLPAIRALLGFATQPLREIERIYTNYGPLAQFELRNRRNVVRRYLSAVGARFNRVVLASPDIFQSVGIMIPGPRDSAQRRMWKGLVGPPSPNQAHYRRLLVPSFRRAKVDELAGRIAEIVDREIADWPVGREVDLYGLCKSVTLHATLETMFERDAPGVSPELMHVVRLLDEHVEMEASPEVRLFQLDLPGTPYRRMLRHSEEFERVILDWVERERWTAPENNLMRILAESTDETGAPGGVQAVLSHLPTLLGAAFETSQAPLAWGLLLLAQHPREAGRLLDTLGEGDDGAQLIANDTLDAVVCETLRILPSTPIQTRRTARDAMIDGFEVPKGTDIVLSPFLTNRDPAIYREPSRFLPARWSEIAPSQYEYLVFSAGPRTCIGSWFASNFQKIALGRIMRRYRVEVRPGARIDQRVRLTLRPGVGGIPVILHRQDGAFRASPIGGNLTEIVQFPTFAAA